jgi:hypothetical protein
MLGGPTSEMSESLAENYDEFYILIFEPDCLIVLPVRGVKQKTAKKWNLLDL